MVAGWIADELEVSVDEVLGLASGGDDPSTTGSVTLDLKDGEWAAFLKKLDGCGTRSQ